LLHAAEHDRVTARFTLTEYMKNRMPELYQKVSAVNKNPGLEQDGWKNLYF